ncbi:MAG: DUF2807 domain-containing protein [Myxococcaceae bacterium]|nr:DUF2807 domain-containing protein [Myxococcaceae bacterium]
MQTLRIALVIPALFVSACAFAQAAGPGGSREERREVPDFDGVAVGHGFKAQVTVGPKSVRVSGDEALVGLVRTEVEDGKLVVRVDRSAWPRRGSGVRLTISSPKLTSVASSGGAKVDAEVAATDTFTAQASGGSELSVRNLDAKQLRVESSGGAEVTLKGRADTAQMEASGGAEVHGQELILEALDVEASGGATVNANPSQRIEADLSGGSTVHVDSSPSQRNVSSSGGARVVFKK